MSMFDPPRSAMTASTDHSSSKSQTTQPKPSSKASLHRAASSHRARRRLANSNTVPSRSSPQGCATTASRRLPIRSSGPHRRWHAVNEQMPISRGLRAGSSSARQLTRSRSRTVGLPTSLRHLPLEALPRTVDQSRNEITFDTNPNRFIRFVFRHWQGLAANLERRVSASSSVGAGPRRRGLTEARWIIDQCDRVLTSGAMREVGELRTFPHGDPVLLRQPGYREVLRVFALAEASMALDATLEDGISQQPNATLPPSMSTGASWSLFAVCRTSAGNRPTGRSSRPRRRGSVSSCTRDPSR